MDISVPVRDELGFGSLTGRVCLFFSSFSFLLILELSLRMIWVGLGRFGLLIVLSRNRQIPGLATGGRGGAQLVLLPSLADFLRLGADL